jgi:hypothetical protein
VEKNALDALHELMPLFLKNHRVVTEILDRRYFFYYPSIIFGGLIFSLYALALAFGKPSVTLWLSVQPLWVHALLVFGPAGIILIWGILFELWYPPKE